MRIQARSHSALTVCVLVAAAAPSGASDRADRQVRVFEQALNTMLVESPNFLVQSTEPTNGSYVEGMGAVFSFRVSLVEKWDEREWWDWRHSDKEDRASWREDELEDQTKRYKKGKDELLDTIVTFGEVLTSLKDTDVIEVRVRLRSSSYFEENDLEKLNVKVKLSDLRSHYDEQLSEKDLLARMTQTEE